MGRIAQSNEYLRRQCLLAGRDEEGLFIHSNNTDEKISINPTFSIRDDPIAAMMNIPYMFKKFEYVLDLKAN